MSDETKKSNVVDLFTRKVIEVEDKTQESVDIAIDEEPTDVEMAKHFIERMAADGATKYIILSMSNPDEDTDAEFAVAMTDDWKTSDLSLASDYLKLEVMHRLMGAEVEADNE